MSSFPRRQPLLNRERLVPVVTTTDSAWQTLDKIMETLAAVPGRMSVQACSKTLEADDITVTGKDLVGTGSARSRPEPSGVLRSLTRRSKGWMEAALTLF
jgi:hypothetical protein